VKPGRKMPRLQVALGLSSALHGALALLLAQAQLDAPRQRQPLLVDFTVDSAAGAPPRNAGPSRKSEPVRARRVRSQLARDERLALPAPPTPVSLLAAEAVPEDEAPSPGAEDGGVAQEIGEAGGEALEGVAGGVEGGTGGVEAATAEYNKAHFEYLRREINKRLVYPELAREMGWEGRVLLSFLVVQDGSVKEVTVTESSGIALLDRSAVTTVHRAAPLPRPPCDVRVVMPIAYVLQ